LSETPIFAYAQKGLFRLTGLQPFCKKNYSQMGRETRKPLFSRVGDTLSIHALHTKKPWSTNQPRLFLL